MAVITLTPQTFAQGKYPTASNSLTWAAVGNSDTVRYTNTGAQLILIRNVHAANAATIATASVALSGSNRTGDIAAETIAAGAVRAWFLAREGWAASNGYTTFTAGGTGTIEALALTIPGI